MYMYNRKKRLKIRPVNRFILPIICGLLVVTGLMNAHSVSESKYGICVHLNPEDIIKKVHGANISCVRMDFRWDSVQPTLADFINGDYHWVEVNKLIDAAAPKNMLIYATLTAVPSWASDGRSGPTPNVIYIDPATGETFTGVRAWTMFVATAVRKYGRDLKQIMHWGIGNEPDYSEQFTGTRYHYVYDMLIPAATIIDNIRTNNYLSMKICAPDLFDEVEYLNYVLDHAGNLVDIVTVHSYGGVSWVMSELDGFVANARGKPVWLTETGFNCSDNSTTAMRAQALWYDEFLPQFQSRSDISKLFMYDAYDPPGSDERCGILYREEGEGPILLKPAYHEYRWVAGSNNSQFVNTPEPFVVLPGDTFTISLTAKNTGTLYWDRDLKYKLDFLNSGSIPYILPGTDLTVNRDEEQEVNPGDEYTFTINIKAPAVLNTYNVIWQMKQDIEPADGSGTVKWFGDTAVTTFTVSPCLAPPQFTTNPISRTINPGGTVTFSVEATEPDTYQWLKDGAPIADEGRYSGTDTAVLTISNVQYEDAGNYKCRVTNCMGSSTSSPGTLTVKVSHSIPGKIQAEDYDIGGEGSAYHDTTPGNICYYPRYRFEDVDIQLASDYGGGYNVGYIAQGEWLNYTVNVTRNTYYDINVRVAAPGGGSFCIKRNGIDITGTRSFKATGGDQTWKTITIPRIILNAGQQKLQFYALSSDFNLNWIDIQISQQAPFGTVKNIPGIIQAEDYDSGGQGIAYNDTTPYNQCYYKAYRYEGVDVENSPVSGPNVINVGYIYSGEWLEYTVDVYQARYYQLYIRVAAPTGGALKLEADDIPLTGVVYIPSNDGPQDYETIHVSNVYLPEGKMIIRIKMYQDLFNLDYIQFQ